MSDGWVSSNAGPGLREAKKQETRQQISDHATRLFLAQGFDVTTIAEIAAAARVSTKTVTNYFARKEDLAFDHQDEFVATLADAVSSRLPDESALASLRRAFEAAVAVQDPVAGFAGQAFTRMISDSPTLSAALRRLHDRREEALADALGEAIGLPRTHIEVRTAAALLGAVHHVLFQRIQELTLQGLPGEAIAETVAAESARAFGLLEPALEDFAVAECDIAPHEAEDR